MPVRKHGFVFADDSDRSQAIAQRDVNSLSSSYTRSYGFVADYGKGSEVWDVEGRRYIDLASGIAVLATGFSHPRIVEAIRDQAERMIHIGGTDFFYEAQVTLAEHLQRIIPINNADQPGDKRIFLANSGTEANEGAMKLARYQGGNNGRRTQIIACYGGFHGRTYGSLSMTASKSIQRADYPFLPGGVVHIPYVGQHAYENAEHRGSIDLHPRKFIEKFVFKKISPDEIAAVFVEPIQGEGGYIVPADHFLPELRQLCDDYGILLVSDEIQAGMGRTGMWTAISHWNVKPDIVAMAKGLGSGVPIGAIVAHRDVMSRWTPGTHGNTFGGNLLACRVASTTIDIIEHENLIDNAAQRGEQIMGRLRGMMTHHPDVITRVDGRGLMIGVEIADPHLRDHIVEAAFLNGLIMLAAGKNVIRFAPALNISEAITREAMDHFEQALQQAVQEAATMHHDDAHSDHNGHHENHQQTQHDGHDVHSTHEDAVQTAGD